ncbi:hypothetical protein EGI16_08700 [Chryseobacterium sp. G0240]|uniref:hypothetical protein n=1 Tax=Chryseobacterium sp. G0240 TaxID=2487066 RepID=UPI000F45482F|nr:hypothetical protein [Chryseobacterium sp. G0240]ROI04732.1 hypothetical protein EGI16_08700 [Chryseobacterium sp. G0240]
MKQKALVIFLYIYALSFSFLKTIREPNEWVKAHWLADYRFGYIKRGLAGEIFGFFFEKNEYQIGIISAVILFLLYLVIMVVAVKHTFQNYSIHKVLFYVAFFLSQYIVLSAHFIGYLDQVIFLLTFLAVYLIRQQKIMLASLLCAVSVPVHEVSFFLMFPICLFTVWLNETGNNKVVISLESIKKIGVFLLIPVVMVLSVSLYQEFFGKDNREMIFHYLQSSGFISNRMGYIVSDAYTESFATYWKQESPNFLKRVFFSAFTIKFWIPIAFMMLMIYKVFRNVNGYVLLFLGMIVLFPLILHAIAWDTFRIWSFPFMILFLGFWILEMQFKDIEQFQTQLNGVEIIFFAITIILTSVSLNGLFDNETERFSKAERVLFLIPVFSVVMYLIKKAPAVNTRTSDSV